MEKVIVSGLLIIASTIAAVLTITVLAPQSVDSNNSLLASNRVATSFVGTNVDGIKAVPDDENGVTLSAWFKNVGSVDVEPISAIDVFLLTGNRLDGRYIPFSNRPTASDSWVVVQPAGSNVWARGETLQIRLTLDPINPNNPGTYMVSLTTPNGVSTDISFEYAQTPLPTPPPTPTPALSAVFVTKWGTQGSGDGELILPQHLAVASDGMVYVADYGNYRIQNFTSEGVFVRKWGTDGAGDGEFQEPSGVAIASDGSVYVSDSVGRIQKFTSAGVFFSKWGSYGTGDGEFSDPNGVAVALDGSVYVADRGNSRIQKFTSDGMFVRKWGTYGTGDGEFVSPRGVAVASDGMVYVADTNNDRIQKFTSEGVFVSQWGTEGLGDGEFDQPNGLAVASDGNVYVSDSVDRIQKFNSDGMFVIRWGTEGSGDGEFIYPNGIAVAPDGSVYVSDQNNHRIQQFSVGQ